jgi:multidrug efflux system membrane fusion protein
MAKIRFHKIAAVAVLIGFAAWMGTGKFSSVGSAAAGGETPPQGQAGASAPEAAKPAEAAPAPRTVAVVTPPRIQHARAIHVRPDRGRQARRSGDPHRRRHQGSPDQRGRSGQGSRRCDPGLDPEEDKPQRWSMASRWSSSVEAELEAAKRLTRAAPCRKLAARQRQSALAQPSRSLKPRRPNLAA